MLTTNVEHLEGNNIKLTITVPAEEVDAAIKKAYDRLGTKVRIPGFRKGKAPRPVVDNYLGREHVLAEATEELVDEVYPRAIDDAAVRPIESPELDEMSPVVEGEEFTFSATVELRPELTLSSVDDIAVTVPPREATEAQVDEQIEIARDKFASLEPVEDRGLEPNDFALISFVGDVAGEPYEGNEVDKYLYELGKGQMPAEFDAGIIGAKPGDARRVEFVIPDTSSNEDFVGKTAGFDVTIHEIKAKVLPEVDDEFAVSVGGYDSVEQMRQDLHIRLSGSQQLAHERAKEEALKEQLAERLVGDVPEAMVRQRTGQMMRDFQNMLEQRGTTVEQYVGSIGATLEALETDINHQAARAVKEDLALEALFRVEGLEVTDEDIDAEIKAMASGGEAAEEMRKRWEDNGLMPILREQIIHQRAVQWLNDHATITESAAAPEVAEAPASETTEE